MPEKIYGHYADLPLAHVIVEHFLPGRVMARDMPTGSSTLHDYLWVEANIRSPYQDIPSILIAWRTFEAEQARLLSILEGIKAAGVMFKLDWIDDRFVLMYHMPIIDAITGLNGNLGASMLLPPDMSEDDLVRAAHQAARDLVEHECDEQFFYQGAQVFNPHRPLSWQESEDQDGR